MGTGVCSRRQKSLLHTGFCLLAVLGLGSGVYLYNYVQDKTRTSEAQAVKFKQQQEALSAQLQVVYEHRSRLERSLQKEKGEHKKTKEDYLVYKLEAQEALNKEKQDSMNRYGALSSQHKILKNQNEEMKKQLSDLQVEHSNLKLEHRKTIELHNQQVSQLQREKDNEILNLQDTIAKLREESKLLRRAHQDVHSQLLGAQAQIEEFRQLKDALKKMPSFKDPGTNTHNQHTLPSYTKNKPFAEGPQSNTGNHQREEHLPGGAAQHGKEASQAQTASKSNSMLHSPSAQVAALGQGMHNDSYVGKFTRTVNSLQVHKEDDKPAVSPHILQPPQRPAVHRGAPPDLPGAADKKTPTANVLVAKEQVPVHSWQDIVSKVNARMTKEEESNRIDASNGLRKAQTNRANVAAGKWEKGAMHHGYLRRVGENEAEMDAGVIDREDGPQPQKQHVGQEALIAEDAADPAKDPNNQGEDEYEEAEIDRPEFEDKVIADKKEVELEGNKKLLVPDTELRSREETEDRYQDDQEQEIDDRGGELVNGDDLELVQDEGVIKADIRKKKEGYY